MKMIKNAAKFVLEILGYSLVKINKKESNSPIPDYFTKSIDKNKISLCVCMPHKYCISETFIHMHIRQLPVNIVPLYGGWFPRRTIRDKLIWGTVGFKRFLRKNKIKAVLAEYGPTGACIIKSCREVNVPVVVHFHGFDASQKSTIEEFRVPYRYMFENAAAIISVSRHMSERLGQLGCPKDKLYCIPYGVDFGGHDQRNCEKKYDFIAVGRFVDKKAPYLTLLAFRRVLDKYPEKKLVMIGNGELLGVCRSLVVALNMVDNVTFTGSLDNVKVKEHLLMSRIFIQHSVTADDGDCEGTPVAILEAGSCGLPVISTFHAGIKDAVVDGSTGYLVSEKDVNGMADRMIELIMAPHLQKEFGRNAMMRISKEYNLKEQIGKLWEVINKSTMRED